MPKTPAPFLSELSKRHPLAFPVDPAAVMPLAINIHKKLIAAGHDRQAVSVALRQHVSSPAYLAALAAGKPRVNLDGEPVGHVSEIHQAEARAALENPNTRHKRPAQRSPIALTGTLSPSQAPNRKKSMPVLELTVAQAKIAFTLDTAAFRAALDMDTAGAKTVPVTLRAGDRTYTAQLNPKSFRKAQAAFREAANPVVSISGNLIGNAIEAAGIQVFDKGGKPAAAEAAKPEPAETTPPPSVAEGQRPRLSLKPKTPA